MFLGALLYPLPLPSLTSYSKQPYSLTVPSRLQHDSASPGLLDLWIGKRIYQFDFFLAAYYVCTALTKEKKKKNTINGQEKKKENTRALVQESDQEKKLYFF